MAVLTVQDVGEGLGSLTFVAADAANDTVKPGAENANFHLDGAFVLVKNDDLAAINVTVSNRPDVYNVPAGAIGVVPCNQGANLSPGLEVAYSAVASVTVAAIHV